MSSIPRDPALDSTLSLMREGYEFIGNRCRQFHSDRAATRYLDPACAKIARSL